MEITGSFHNVRLSGFNCDKTYIFFFCRVLFVEAEDSEGASAMKYYGDSDKPLADLPVNSKFFRKQAGFTGIELKNEIVAYLEEVQGVEGWPNWVLGNRDTERSTYRLGAKLIDAMAMVQLLLPGTPFTYYGEEIGMEDVAPVNGSLGTCPTGNTLTANSNCNQARSPYQWDSTPNKAGFTNATLPWYPIGDNLDTINAKDQMSSTNSYLNIYRELVNLRKQPAIMHGTMNVLNVTSEDIFAFAR
jgi:glycosidase